MRVLPTVKGVVAAGLTVAPHDADTPDVFDRIDLENAYVASPEPSVRRVRPFNYALVLKAMIVMILVVIGGD